MKSAFAILKQSCAVGLALLCMGMTPKSQAEVYVLTAQSSKLEEVSLRELRNLYRGRTTVIAGQPVTPVNAAPGSKDRQAFLEEVLQVSELDYTGYWHVRRYSGQGVPPKETPDRLQLFETIGESPNRIGYLKLDNGEPLRLPQGLKVLRVRP